MKPNGTFRAQVGDRRFDFTFQHGALTLNDTAADYAFEGVSPGCYALRLNGRSMPVVVEPQPNGPLRVTLNGRQVTVRVQDERALLLERFGLADEAAAAEREVRAPMPGLVLKIVVEPGQEVKEGDGLLVLEAMKMENEMRASFDGVIRAVHVAPGDAVGKNELLLELE